MIAVYTAGAVGFATCGMQAELTFKVVVFYVIVPVGHAVYGSRHEFPLDEQYDCAGVP
jgi:hypothetical protein